MVVTQPSPLITMASTGKDEYFFMLKYHIITFGCQMNISDSERIASLFEKHGIKQASSEKEADFIIINMCSVRQSAVNRVHGLIPKFEKLPHHPTTILTGCSSPRDRRILQDKLTHILDIKDMANWPEIIGLKSKNKDKFANYLCIEPSYSNKFSAGVPIMTGCNNFCAYCIVPYARGREVSRSAKDIVSEVKKLVESGHKEIWLLGQNVNSYKSGGINFPKLFKQIDKIPGDFWIRFTSPHPKDFSDELIEVLTNAKKYPKYLNLPVQAGSNKILKKMNRPYTREKYLSLVKKIKHAMPDIAISTDIIVGFPGETKKDFKDSENLFKEVSFDMAYLNKYSPRPGTVAEKMKDDVTREEKSRRERTLNEILKKTALINNTKLIGKEDVVLIDSEKESHSVSDKVGTSRDKLEKVWLGKTTGYKTIKVKSSQNLLGKFVKVKIESATAWGLFGNVIK